MINKIKKESFSQILIGGILLIGSILGVCLLIYIITQRSGAFGRIDERGFSVFVETLQELGYDVEKTNRPFFEEATENIVFVTSDSLLELDDENFLDWIARGGTCAYIITDVYIDRAEELLNYEDEKEDDEYAYDLYTYGSGRLILIDEYYLCNECLVADKKCAYRILKGIAPRDNQSIHFNSSTNFSLKTKTKGIEETEEKKTSLWDIIPKELKFIIYQIILSLVLYFYYKGRRFGRVEVLYEESERSKNEFIYALSTLYRKARCSEVLEILQKDTKNSKDRR